jgi:DNA-binding NarL/FixJ family response regulator
MAKMLCARFGYPGMKGTTHGGDALSRLIRGFRPRIVFFEESFYDTATPYMIKRLQDAIPALPVAVFSLGECPTDRETRFLFFGVERYISLRCGMADFIHGFKAILDGKKYVTGRLRRRLEGLEEIPEPSRRESGREDEVLLLLANGKRVREIAGLLEISERTAAHHRSSIFSRYQVANTAQMIRSAQNAGKIKLDGCYCLLN